MLLGTVSGHRTSVLLCLLLMFPSNTGQAYDNHLPTGHSDIEPIPMINATWKKNCQRELPKSNAGRPSCFLLRRWRSGPIMTLCSTHARFRSNV